MVFMVLIVSVTHTDQQVYHNTKMVSVLSSVVNDMHYCISGNLCLVMSDQPHSRFISGAQIQILSLLQNLNP
jgi:hypothetical protein